MMSKYWIILLLIAQFLLQAASAQSEEPTYLLLIREKSKELKISDSFADQVSSYLGKTANQAIPKPEISKYSDSIDLFLNVNAPLIPEKSKSIALSLAFCIDDSIQRKSPSSACDESMLAGQVSRYLNGKFIQGMEPDKDIQAIQEINRKMQEFKTHMLTRIEIYQADCLFPAFRDRNHETEIIKTVEQMLGKYSYVKFDRRFTKEYMQYVDRTLVFLEEIVLVHVIFREVQLKIHNHDRFGPLIYNAEGYDKTSIPQRLQRRQWPIILLLQPANTSQKPVRKT